jgi:hypothetical protein
VVSAGRSRSALGAGAYFVVSDDVARSRRFNTDVPGGKTAMESEPPVAMPVQPPPVDGHKHRAVRALADGEGTPPASRLQNNPIRALLTVR